MGNVNATSATPHKWIRELDSAFDESEGIQNPGTLEDIHSKCKNVFPHCFEGAKVILTRGLSSHFQISHTVNMSSILPSCYRFGATYVGTKQFSSTEAYPILLGDVDPSGNLNATIVHQLTPSLNAKFGAQIDNSRFNVAQLNVNFKGKDFTASAIMANPDIMRGTGALVLHYFQAITKKLAVGTEIAFQRGPIISAGQLVQLSLAARYGTENYQWSGTLGVCGAHLCYYQRATKDIQIGVEFELNRGLRDAVTSIGYQIDLPKNEFVFKGFVDSNLCVGTTMEKKMEPMPFTLTLSSLMNHSKNQYRFGIGLVLG